MIDDAVEVIGSNTPSIALSMVWPTVLSAASTDTAGSGLQVIGKEHTKIGQSRKRSARSLRVRHLRAVSRLERNTLKFLYVGSSRDATPATRHHPLATLR
ncbi:hypothetical protein GCM10027047_33870 [Rhodococcus aerolatus]